MDYEKALQVEQAIKDIKCGLDIFNNIDFIEDSISYILENEKNKQYKKENGINFMYGDVNPLKEATRAVTALTAVKPNYETAMNDLRVYETETQDILHAIELADVDAEKMLELGRELRDVRQKRRMAKDFVELLKPLNDVTSKHSEMTAELRKAHGEMQKISDRLKNRIYTPREKTTMGVAFLSSLEKLEGAKMSFD